MASFDPSTIAQIGASGPNPAGAVTQAYKLKDLMSQEQLDQLRLGNEEEQQQDIETARNILKGRDLSTDAGRTQAASDLSKAGLSDKAIDLMRTSGQMRLQQQQLDTGKLQQLQFAANTIGPAAVSVKQTLQTKGLAMAQAQYQALLPQILKGLPPEIAAKIPARPPQDPVAFSAMLDREIAGSQQARQMIMDQSTLTKNTAETQNAQARTKALQSGKLVPVQNADGTVSYEPSSQAAGKTPGATGGRYGIQNPTTQAGEDLKDQFIGATGGRVTLAQLRALNFDDLAKRGVSAASLVQSGLTYTGQTRAAGAIGQRAGNIGILEGSIDQAADQVRSALAGVNRTNVQAVNRALAAGRTQFGNAAESRYAAAVQTLVNEYSRVVSGGTGASTDSARADAQRLLSTAQTPEQVGAVLKQMQREVGIVKSAASRAMGSTGNAPAATSGGQTVDWNSLPP